MRVILKQVEDNEGEDEEMSESELLALSQQKEHFITLYPNPFVNNVLIAYELETDAQVSVSVYDLTGNPVPATLEPGVMQAAGKHQYTLYGGNLKKGMYIVQVMVNGEIYTRMVIKD
ncbi:T9SS type A sorting domain-containing protein [Mariniflexile sp. HMF6888]|uniref:T9SS type A sorting domain-containing protein n=1 Tax=Mariniflexile sp. HMF6888 TaxID=3373086 RepID=UPI00379C4E1A